MKWQRVVLAVMVTAVAACSSPTVPRLPNPDSDDRDPVPDQPGLVDATISPVQAPTSG